MPFVCSARASAHCAGEDLFDPAYRDPDGAAICIACAVALGMHDPRTDAPRYADDRVAESTDEPLTGTDRPQTTGGGRG